MPIVLQIAILLLSALVLTTTLAHALEFPGKKKLAKEDYLKVQRIYYPGFTTLGVGEPIAVLGLVLQAFVVRNDPTTFRLTLAALLAMLAVVGIYWLVTHPINKYWVEASELGGAGKSFFGETKSISDSDWTALRDRWEYSHITRAAFAMLAFLLVSIGASIQ
ncbi:MAG: DUF1772 domain-containing protein [Shinella sp.]|nr:DUF1772 domain-containing protein [Shinella sp.]